MQSSQKQTRKLPRQRMISRILWRQSESKKKDDAVASIKSSGLGFAKAVKAAKQKEEL